MNEYLLKITVKNAVKEALAENERYGYEWEKSTSKKEEENIRKRHISRLQEEIKRISGTTLRHNWSNPDDRKIWEDKLKKLNSELLYWEEEDRKSRK